jgi:hypothetical protein
MCGAVIGTVRRECLDRMLVIGETYLANSSSYAAYYNEVRTHLAWAKMRPWTGQFNGPATLSPSQSCPGCTTITSGYNFWKVTGTERVLLQ